MHPVSGAQLNHILSLLDSGHSAHKISSLTCLHPTTISGLTLTNGKAATDGGAIVSVEPLTLNNVAVRGSYAGTHGGGVFVNTPGKISIVNSRIVHNVAVSGSGGLYLQGAAGVSVVKTTIADNVAGFAGGLYARANGAKSSVVIDTCVVSNNNATLTEGGGLNDSGPDKNRGTVVARVNCRISCHRDRPLTLPYICFRRPPRLAEAQNGLAGDRFLNSALFAHNKAAGRRPAAWYAVMSLGQVCRSDTISSSALLTRRCSLASRDSVSCEIGSDTLMPSASASSRWSRSFFHCRSSSRAPA